MKRDHSFGGYECVNLSRADTGMSQQLLDHPQICTSIQQVSGKGVSEAVSTEGSFDPLV